MAGEASGDAHGAALAAALAGRVQGLRLVGTGGPAMAAAGVELLAGLDDLAVMGFAEVLPRLGFFARLERRVRALLEEGRVRLVVLVDFPGFNLRVARAARALGVRVLYYVAPQVWAWRPGRASVLAEVTDEVAAILPFEVEVLRARGVRATFVGHPLLDRCDDVASAHGFRARWGLDDERPLLALLPGSRRQELRRHLGTFVAAARMVQRAHPDVLPVISRAASLPESLYAGSGFPVVDDTRALLRHARATLVKSGTATLEAALEGTPSVVAYRTSAASWAVARRLVKVEHVALPNLIAGERIVPELLQTRATPRALADALMPLLDDGPERACQVDGFARVRTTLGGPGATARVADMARRLLEAGA